MDLNAGFPPGRPIDFLRVYYFGYTNDRLQEFKHM